MNKKDIATLIVAAAVGFVSAPLVVSYVVDHSTTMTEANPPFGVDGQGPATNEEVRTKALTGEALRLDMIKTLCETKEVVCK